MKDWKVGFELSPNLRIVKSFRANIKKEDSAIKRAVSGVKKTLRVDMTRVQTSIIKGR